MKRHLQACTNSNIYNFTDKNSFLNWKQKYFPNYLLQNINASQNEIYYCSNRKIRLNYLTGRKRAPRAHFFYKQLLSSCSGTLSTKMMDSQTLQVKHNPCTNIQHIFVRKLDDNIFNRVQVGLETFKIKQAFMAEFKMNISRHLVNNIKYKYNFENPYKTDKSDLISIQTFIQEFNIKNKIYSNIDDITAIEDLLLIFQSDSQKKFSSQFTTISIDSTHKITKYIKLSM